jgi:ribonuclease R
MLASRLMNRSKGKGRGGASKSAGSGGGGNSGGKPKDRPRTGPSRGLRDVLAAVTGSNPARADEAPKRSFFSRKPTMSIKPMAPPATAGRGAPGAEKDEDEKPFSRNKPFRAKSGDRFQKSADRNADRNSEKRSDGPRKDGKRKDENRKHGGSGKGLKSRGGNFPAKSDKEGGSFRPRRGGDSGGKKSGSSSGRRGGGKDPVTLEGIVKRHPDGFGFLIPDNPEFPDAYISRQYMTGVMTNDRVRADVYAGREADRLFGEVVEILNHAVKRVVGRYLPVDQKYGMILDDKNGWGADLRIAAAHSMGAKEGDMVAVEIISYPGRQSDFVGKVVDLLGDLSEPLSDVKRVIFSQGIPQEFSAQALKDAQVYGGVVREDEIRGRVDLRNKPLITIDGATARDFDDAIYTEATTTGFHVLVAIADVSHYVKPGSKLDEEAYERGTSTYFPNFVVPMLPEELSNELCSLKPNVVRLCFVCEMEIDFQGVIRSHKFYEGVMNSKARVTYGEAQEVIDHASNPKLAKSRQLPKEVDENILHSRDLAKILMAKRFEEGSLDLEIPETQVVVNEAGESVDIIKSERLFAHRLIEELMLAANISVARFIDEKQVPGLYRIHEEPFEENVANLQRFLWNFGNESRMEGGKLQKKITKALQSFAGKPEAQILNILTLRTMNQAKYSKDNLGHFGLGFTHYAHFTSPIRRYPDLIIHRITKSLIDPVKFARFRMTEDELGTAGTMLSACEQRSTKAERQLISIKKSRFMERFLGEEFDGMISSVTKFGVFVLLRAYDVDGLIKIEELGNDKFVFDPENLRLIGKRTGRNFCIGDMVRVQVAKIDPEAGRIDFILAEEQPENRPPVERPGFVASVKGEERSVESSKNSQKTRKDIQKRGKTEDDRRGVRGKRVSKRRRKN